MRKLIAALSLLCAAGIALAQSPEEKALEIVKKQDAQNSDFEDYTADMTMVLRNAQGDETTRYLRAFVLEVEDDGDKSKLVFDKPADVKGTAMLTYSHGLEPDDQWLFLPAVKRVKRLNSRNKSGPFMGSEFAYEDLSSQEVEKYAYKYLKEEACGEWQCHVIERIPQDKFSGYTKQVVWIDQEGLRNVKIDYYDRKEELLKTLENTGFKIYLDRYWQAEVGTMTNHQTGKSTVLNSTNINYKVGLKARDFKPNALERTR